LPPSFGFTKARGQTQFIIMAKTFIKEEYLDVIYTKEDGQVQISVPLSLVPDVTWKDKKTFEQFLIFTYHALSTARQPKGEIIGDGIVLDKAETPKALIKISTLFVSRLIKTPPVFDKWDGKFYYNDQVEFKGK